MFVIYILAKNTFKEILRDRILYVLLIFTVLLMGLSFAIGQLAYEEIFRLTLGLGLSGVHLCFCGLTIFLGSGLFYREIENRVIHTLLVRPVHRWQYLFSKFLGVLAVLVVLTLGFSICFIFIQLWLSLPILMTTYFPFVGMFLEGCVLLAVTFFFASFCSPYVAAGCSVAVFLVGHWSNSLEKLVEKVILTLFES